MFGLDECGAAEAAMFGLDEPRLFTARTSRARVLVGFACEQPTWRPQIVAASRHHGRCPGLGEAGGLHLVADLLHRLPGLRRRERQPDDVHRGAKGWYAGPPSTSVRTFRRGSNAAQTQSGQLLSGSLPRRARGADSLMISSEI